jgi:hypothetical protein
LAKFELILKNNPTALEIVETFLANKSPRKKELLKMVVEGEDQQDARKVLAYFLAHDELTKVK